MTTKFTIRLKGGAGSGNFGHRGRPGQVGGSMPKDSAGVSSEDEHSLTASVSAARKSARASGEFESKARKVLEQELSELRSGYLENNAFNYTFSSAMDPSASTKIDWDKVYEDVKQELPGELEYWKDRAGYDGVEHQMRLLLSRAMDNPSENSSGLANVLQNIVNNNTINWENVWNTATARERRFRDILAIQGINK